MASQRSRTDPAGLEGLELDHVALAVDRIAEAGATLVGRLGGRRYDCGPGRGFRWAQWSFARGEKIEILEPDGPAGGFLHRFLERNGPGVHHVTLKVADIRSAAVAARAFGYDVVGYDDRNPGWKEMFLHPKQAQGIVVQLAEADPELDQTTLGPDGPFPPFDGRPAEPATVVGLRLLAASGAAAERQWAELLGGRMTTVGDTLVFSWERSPLTIRVTIDENATPGPVAIEVNGAAGLTVGSDALEALGTRFVAVDAALGD
jgi:hypothetical protein